MLNLRGVGDLAEGHKGRAMLLHIRDQPVKQLDHMGATARLRMDGERIATALLLGGRVIKDGTPALFEMTQGRQAWLDSGDVLHCGEVIQVPGYGDLQDWTGWTKDTSASGNLIPAMIDR